jgi:hypothetical protein
VDRKPTQLGHFIVLFVMPPRSAQWPTAISSTANLAKAIEISRE